MRRIVCALAIAVFAAACGHSEIGTSPGGQTDESILPPSFVLSSDFPADILIPDIEGMKSTAFIVSTSMPAAVIAVDIDKNPMRLSNEFSGLISPEGSGIPARLVISAKDEAFLLTSTSIIYFNPENGYIYYNTSATRPVDIGIGFKNSDGSTASSTIAPSFPSGMARIGNRLFVATANYISTEAPSYTAPGTVQVFEIQDGELLERVDSFVTSAFNPTGLAVRNSHELIVTNSGVLNIVDAQGTPLTKSSIDVIDPDAMPIRATIDLGMAAAAFHPAAITYDGSRAFVGSFAYGNVYEIDLINRQVLRGTSNPHEVTMGSDYITDVDLAVDNSFFFAASFEESSVYPFDMRSDAMAIVGDPFIVGYSSGVTPENPSGANTGAGPMAVRPGTRGVDYDGADLFVLTGYPGTLVAIRTDAPAEAYRPNEETAATDNDVPPPEGDTGEPCQGFAQAVYSVSYGANAGFGQSKFPDVVLGPPEGNGSGSGSLDVLSLGKYGVITLDLGNCSAVNGPGADFIVFENVFYISGNPNAPFAELGAVAVSDDGINFVEFECDSDSLPYTGCAGWHPTYSNPSNKISPFDPDMAGGDAFDLSDIGMDEARYIKIEDVGTGGGGAPTAGFDLDAVAVINGKIEN